MNTFKPGILASIVLVLFAGRAQAHGDDPPIHSGPGPKEIDSSPLVQKVRRATARFRDINVARAEGYVVQVPCASGPGGGAMGVHLVNPDLLSKEIDAETPEALMYEPQPNGNMKLVGVEYITLAADWVNEVPVLEGHLPHYAGAPNRYGLPAFYELHVWAWRHNPSGVFADWNPRVTCAKQPLP